MIEIKKIYIIFLFFAIFSACRQPSVPEKMVTFSQHQWKVDNRVKIEIENSDSISFYNIFVVIRHTTAFKYNNLLLHYTAFAKDTVTSKINIPLGNGRQWNGDALDDIVETRVKINTQPQKLKKGNNIFMLQQLMPDSVLDNILNVGVRVEKIKK
jgi:gliding motility-associated lipoprotein GldH